MAQQALTAQVAVGGRLTLGIGVSHRSTIEDWLGLPYAHPARHIEEYLSVLRPLLRESGVDFQGREFRVATELQIPDADMVSCPVVMAALGPRMLEIAGRLADGTVTWMTGPNTLRDHVVPRLQESVAVTDHPDRARARADRLFQHYAVLPKLKPRWDLHFGVALLNEWEVVLSWRHEAKTASLQSSSQERRQHQEIPVSDT